MELTYNENITYNEDPLFTILPPELTFQIFCDYLSCHELLIIRLVSKRWYSFVSDNCVWIRLLKKLYNCTVPFLSNYLQSQENLYIKHLLLLSMCGREEVRIKLVPTLTSGGQQSNYYNLSNVVAESDDSPAYCTGKPGGNLDVDVILKSSSTFILTRVEITSPNKYYSAPVKSALIFVNSDKKLIQTDDLSSYSCNQFNKTDWNSLQQRRDSNTVIPADEPVAAFWDMSVRGQRHNESVVYTQHVNFIFGNTILLRLLESGGDTFNIDIHRFKAFGYSQSLPTIL